ncbi:MAG: hypothetical protein U5R30_21845 [Deltaproteobacteria bacterium]|nr:hypothetical protein [Deltaproteobacteria bacterium]
MNTGRTALVLCMVLLLPAAGFAEAPLRLAGFTLGDEFSKHEDLVDMQTRMPLRHSRSIDAVEVQNQAGFKYGMIWVGNCTVPNRIVSIRMKYADPSKNFYDELLKRFKKRFGEPSEWQGDPFHIVISWKWSFVDEQKNRISMILQHNQKDEDETVGNTVKLTMWNLIEEERHCEDKKSSQSTGRSTKIEAEPPNWDLLIPR